ncbi:MAG TPA: LamG-like jellyroll fold domain-containing protein [Chthoniobacteraceae bacterium]|nr:LamG-like jellyroll fold domain-containing protein [Chthoniobacteraceae bacterium]
MNICFDRLKAAALALLLAAAPSPVFAQTRPLTPEEAEGPEVLACWVFDPAAPEADSSPGGHTLSLRGKDTRLVNDERWKGALEIGSGNEPGDRRQGASAGNAPDLSPAGAFTLELWIQPAEALFGTTRAVLLDKKYLFGTHPEGNSDYMLSLVANPKGGWRLEAELGFEGQSATMRSAFFNPEPGEWMQVAFTYDGKGKGAFFLNGNPWGERLLEGRGPIHPGERPLIIGDRVGSVSHRFHGRIAQVRISSTVREMHPSEMAILRLSGERTAFRRMEQKPHLKVEVTNPGAKPLGGTRLAWENGEAAVPEIGPRKSAEVEIPVDATRKPGTYRTELTLLSPQGRALGKPLAITWDLLPRPVPGRMPVILWGSGDAETVSDLGFTHSFALWQTSRADPVAFFDTEGIRQHRLKLDEMLRAGVGAVAQISLGRNAAFREKYARRSRSGKRRPTVNGLFPEVQASALDLGGFLARHFGDLPALEMALINTEVRDHTRPSFHEIDRKAFREATGKEIPAEVEAARGVSYEKLPGFPPDRLIADDHPILAYYRWFWKEGDGWNRLHSLVREGIRKNGGKGIRTWFDPAVRAPSLFGSGGEVDFISSWTYSYPDPLKVSLATGELFAMAEGKPGQKVMTMTQAIWYRHRTAPLPGDATFEPTGEPARWEKENADARFITMAPDHLTQSFWHMLAEPVAGVMLHGWGSLTGKSRGSYIMTHPETRQRLKHLVKEVVEPLGPMLMQVPDAPRNVAFLESFTSQMFAGRGTYGWGTGWGSDSYLMARYAGLDPRIVFEETLAEKGLAGVSILFVTDCDVLTRGMAKTILAFQERGGIVIGDENLAPGIQPDVLVESFRRTGRADEDKASLLARAAALKKEIAAFHAPPVSSDNPEVLLKLRGKGEYLFAVNDHRKFGHYVGRHRLVMEEGVASRATIRWKTPGRVVYDLVRRQPVAVTRLEGGELTFPLELPGGGGALLLALERPVGGIGIAVPEEAKRGESVRVTVTVKGEDGEAITANVPVEIRIFDSKGEPAERSGHYGAARGKVELTLDLALNDEPGRWQIVATEGLTGRRRAATLEVR